MDEIILVDIYDNQIGTIEKLAAHKKPLLHRAFSVFVMDGDSVLIQKRAQSKYHSGGLWANACCSHPRNGEDLQEAVGRRLAEEVGISTDVAPEELFSFVYQHKFHQDLYEYELDHVFVLDYAGPISANPEEIAETRWIPKADLAKELVEEPEKFAPWFLIAAPAVLKMCR